VTHDEVRLVIVERLHRWGERLADGHATPVVLVGVGHDHASGQILVVTLEEHEIRAEVIAAFLLAAVDQLRAVEPAAQPDPQWTRGTLTTILEHLRATHARLGAAGPGCGTCEQFIRGLGGAG